MTDTTLDRAVVAITGGGRGIGRAIAEACAARGARVALGDIDAALAEQAARSLGGYGGALDVRDRASFNDFLQTAARRLGPVDVLVNNAGIMPMGPFDTESDALSDAQIDINLRGVILGCKLAVPSMLESGGGHIVNVASLAGVLPLPGAAVYCATKFAVRGLTLSLREEYRDSGIAFSAVLPSKITTDLAAGTEQAGKGVPTASPEDVAAAVINAIEQRLPEVTVPRYLRGLPAMWAAIPHRAERVMRRMFGDRRMLDALDRAARADYDQRMARMARPGN
ncbi:SDR family oxidoreductase [Algiphilus sp.]|uniref:SDR family oxidoreductase n=1 Tax=Algiphilus sp. TaxID=1872431 RepID=UPI003C3BFCA7